MPEGFGILRLQVNPNRDIWAGKEEIEKKARLSLRKV